MQQLNKIVRNFGLIKFADKARFYIHYIKTYKTRKEFRNVHPSVILPPAYFLYETFNLNYFSFYDKSIETAEWLISFFKKYKKLKDLHVLDWGCGPGRVIRHLPDLLDSS